MKEILNKLWDEYYSEECATLTTRDEREHARRIAEERLLLDGLLDTEQRNALDRYQAELYSAHERLLKKAFFKGCRLSLSLICASDGDDYAQR